MPFCKSKNLSQQALCLCLCLGLQFQFQFIFRVWDKQRQVLRQTLRQIINKLKPFTVFMALLINLSTRKVKSTWLNCSLHRTPLLVLVSRISIHLFVQGLYFREFQQASIVPEIEPYFLHMKPTLTRPYTNFHHPKPNHYDGLKEDEFVNAAERVFPEKPFTVFINYLINIVNFETAH